MQQAKEGSVAQDDDDLMVEEGLSREKPESSVDVSEHPECSARHTSSANGSRSTNQRDQQEEATATKRMPHQRISIKKKSRDSGVMPKARRSSIPATPSNAAMSNLRGRRSHVERCVWGQNLRRRTML